MVKCQVFIFITTFLGIGSCSEKPVKCDIEHFSIAMQSEYFKRKYNQDSLLVIIDSLIPLECPQVDTLLYEFTVESAIYRQYSLRALARKKSPLYIRYLKENKDSIDAATLSWSINWLPRKDIWINGELNKLFIDIALNHFKVSYRIDAARYLSDVCRYEDAEKLKETLDVEPDERVIRWVYECLIRYQSECFDSIVSAGIMNGNISNPYFYSMAVKLNNRYDLLPVILKLKEKLIKEKDKIKIESTHKILITLNDVIPYLEKKKDEKAAIGLPLDWGTTNSLGKE